MTRYKLTALLMAFVLAFSLLIAPAAYADKTVNLTDLINSTDTATEEESSETSAPADSLTVENDEKAASEGKVILAAAVNEFEQPASSEYIRIASKGYEYGEYDGKIGKRALVYVAGNSVSGYKAPDGKDKIIDLPLSEPVVPVAERGDYYCVYVICDEVACWVKKGTISDNFYHQNDPVVESLRDELSSWTDIREVCITNGSIIGLKYDGSTVSARYEPYGVDISNWGKLKSIGALHRSLLYAIPANSKTAISTMVYSSYQFCYPNHNDMKKANSAYTIEKNDLRYLSGVEKLFGSLDYGTMVLLNDGTIHNAEFTHIAEEDNWSMDYAFTQDGKWRYVKCDQNNSRILYSVNNGKIDWDNGTDVTSDSQYAIENIACNIVDVQAKYPDEAFTAITADGELLVYGFNAMHMNDEAYTYNYNFVGVDSLVNEYIGIKNGKLVTLYSVSNSEMGYSSSVFHADVYERWSNIEYVYADSSALIAVSSYGKIYVDSGDSYGFDSGRYDDAEDWSEKVVFIDGMVDYEWGKCAFLLGVTEDGNVLISGILPDEAA